MVFARVALLQQDAALRVHHEDREGAVEEAGAMHNVLAPGADGAVAFIYEDQLLLSRTRRCARHAFNAASLACFAFNRSIRLDSSTTKRVCVPLLISSTSSLAETSNTTLRPSTEATRPVIP